MKIQLGQRSSGQLFVILQQKKLFGFGGIFVNCILIIGAYDFLELLLK